MKAKEGLKPDNAVLHNLPHGEHALESFDIFTEKDRKDISYGACVAGAAITGVSVGRASWACKALPQAAPRAWSSAW